MLDVGSLTKRSFALYDLLAMGIGGLEVTLPASPWGSVVLPVLGLIAWQQKWQN